MKFLIVSGQNLAVKTLLATLVHFRLTTFLIFLNHAGIPLSQFCNEIYFLNYCEFENTSHISVVIAYHSLRHYESTFSQFMPLQSLTGCTAHLPRVGSFTNKGSSAMASRSIEESWGMRTQRKPFTNWI
jgi:hypothetical protein